MSSVRLKRGMVVQRPDKMYSSRPVNLITGERVAGRARRRGV